jgi:hypothetical protein
MLAVDPSNQIKKERPLVLKEQAEPADSSLEPGEFAVFPKVKDGKVELFVKGKDTEGNVTPAANITKDGAAIADSGDWVTQTKTLTSGQVSSKTIALSPTPKFPGEVCLTVLGGLEQVNGVDFEVVSGNILTWDGLGLDGDLEAGDQIILKYFA